VPVCLSVSLPVCRSVYLPVCFTSCLAVCLSACLPICLSACLPVCWSAYLPVHLSACLAVCRAQPTISHLRAVPAHLPSHLCACIAARSSDAQAYSTQQHSQAGPMQRNTAQAVPASGRAGCINGRVTASEYPSAAAAVQPRRLSCQAAAFNPSRWWALPQLTVHITCLISGLWYERSTNCCL
jgi:hypothetical protein